MKYYIEAVGLIAGCCTSVSFVPQVIKTYKEKSAKGVSMWMYLVCSFGILLWLFYGIMLNAISLILINIFSLLLTLSVVAMKYMWDRDKSKVKKASLKR
jgi:MtN3 and saliva related transmembrane protein